MEKILPNSAYFYNGKEKLKKILKNGNKCLFNEIICTKTINSHTISKKSLKYIASNDGELYSIELEDFKKLQEFYNDKFIKPTKRHINSIGTFNLFCQNHDNELFRTIDNDKIEPNKYQIFMSHFRGLALSYYSKNKDHEIIKQTINTTIPENNEVIKRKNKIKDLLPISYLVKEQICEDFIKYLELLKSENYDSLEHYFQRFNKFIPLTCCDILSPVIDMNKNRIVEHINIPNDYMNVYLANDEMGGYILITWDKKYKNIIKFVKTITNNLNRFFCFIIFYSDNYYFSIDWFEKLSVIKKKNILTYATGTKYILRNDEIVRKIEENIYEDWIKYIDIEIVST